MQTQGPTTVAQELFFLFRKDPVKFLQQADRRILEAKDRHRTANDLTVLLLQHCYTHQDTRKGEWTRTAGIDYAHTLALEYGLPDKKHARTLINLVTAAGNPHRFAELVKKLLGNEHAPTESDIIVMARAYCDSQARSAQTEAELRTLITEFCSERMAKQIYEMKSEDGRSWTLETPPKKKQ